MTSFHNSKLYQFPSPNQAKPKSTPSKPSTPKPTHTPVPVATIEPHLYPPTPLVIEYRHPTTRDELDFEPMTRLDVEELMALTQREVISVEAKIPILELSKDDSDERLGILIRARAFKGHLQRLIQKCERELEKHKERDRLNSEYALLSRAVREVVSTDVLDKVLTRRDELRDSGY